MLAETQLLGKATRQEYVKQVKSKNKILFYYMKTGNFAKAKLPSEQMFFPPIDGVRPFEIFAPQNKTHSYYNGIENQDRKLKWKFNPNLPE
ncbi:MAG: hypothetical protein ACHQRM_10885, partial [Bacteroidia bacterium]